MVDMLTCKAPNIPSLGSNLSRPFNFQVRGFLPKLNIRFQPEGFSFQNDKVDLTIRVA